MTLEYTPASDNAGDRMFGGFGSSPWLQNAYARMEDPTVTVVAIVVGSDEFANRNKEAWPMYISCPNFTTEMIQSQRYWKVAGFFPKLEDSGLSNFDRKRGLRLAHDRCRCAVLHEVIEIGKVIPDTNQLMSQLQQVGIQCTHFATMVRNRNPRTCDHPRCQRLEYIPESSGVSVPENPVKRARWSTGAETCSFQHRRCSTEPLSSVEQFSSLLSSC